MLEANRRTLGPDHPWTVLCTIELGVTLAALNEHVEARALLEDGLERSKRHYGVDDGFTFSVARDLLETLHALGDVAAIEACEDELAGAVSRRNGSMERLQAFVNERRAERGLPPRLFTGQLADAFRRSSDNGAGDGTSGGGTSSAAG
jgi:hypothetical protein